MYRKKLNIWITRFCMRISTWNKNSVRFRIANALRFLKEFGLTAGMLKEALAKGHGKK